MSKKDMNRFEEIVGKIVPDLSHPIEAVGGAEPVAPNIPSEDEVYDAIIEQNKPSSIPDVTPLDQNSSPNNENKGVSNEGSVSDTGADYIKPEDSTVVEAPTETKPEEKTDWQKQYEAELDYRKQYLEREFDYDIDTDELYKTYRKQALDTAERIQRNTTAQAAGLTGGYGSSYASAVGAEAASDYMRSFDETVPQELYDVAYARYQREGEELLKKAEAAKAYGDELYLNSDEYSSLLQVMQNEQNEAALFEFTQKLTGSKLENGKTPEQDIQEKAITMTEDDFNKYVKTLKYDDGSFLNLTEVKYLTEYAKNIRITYRTTRTLGKNGYTALQYARNLVNDEENNISDEDLLDCLSEWKFIDGKGLTTEEIMYIIENL